MSRAINYQATREQLQAIYNMPDEEAAAQSAELATTGFPLLGYGHNRGGSGQDILGQDTTLDVGRVAYELSLRLTDEAEPTAGYVVGPHTVVDAGRVVLREIAVWVPNSVPVTEGPAAAVGMPVQPEARELALR